MRESLRRLCLCEKRAHLADRRQSGGQRQPGRGLVKESKKAIIFSNIIYLLSSILLLSFGFGIVGISIAFLIQSISLRLYSSKYFYDNELKKSLKKSVYILNKKEAFSILWNNSWKMGVVSFGAFLILQAKPFFL